MMRWLLALACLCAMLPPCAQAQNSPAGDSAAAASNKDAELKFVVYLSRHGVRSPTGLPAQYNVYSKSAWPQWDVPPAYLTKHGYHLMELFGQYDRMQLASLGLLSPQGCGDAGNVRIIADSDERTIETGKAIAQGMYPGCNVAVKSLPENTPDPLFHLDSALLKPGDSALAAAGIAGRIGGKAENLTQAYHAQIAALDELLANCGPKNADQRKRTSLFDIPATVSASPGDHAAELKGPLNTAATMTENMLLEYTEGMDNAKVAWGCIDGTKLRELLYIHTTGEDFAQRTPAVAKIQASTLLDQIHRAMEQAATGKAVLRAPTKPTDRVLFLAGHDTNVANVAGLLNFAWIADGHRDDTSPGGAVVFELWKQRGVADYFVRAYYTTQTLEQMRNSTPLTLSAPPERVQLAIPACSGKDLSCSWTAFSRVMREAIEPRFVSTKEAVVSTRERVVSKKQESVSAKQGFLGAK